MRFQKSVIADSSGRNLNVFYEIGLAHAIGVPVILITRSSDDVPFDLRHRREINRVRSDSMLRSNSAKTPQHQKLVCSDCISASTIDGRIVLEDNYHLIPRTPFRF